MTAPSRWLVVAFLWMALPAALEAAEGRALIEVSLAPPAVAPLPFLPSRAALSLPIGVIRSAMTFLGVPYVHGGVSREGLDCSGLIYRVFHDLAGLDLPRGVDGLYRGAAVVGAPLHLGDLVFFDTTERGIISLPTHVGVYSGQGHFVHAASEGSRTGVIVSALRDPYYSARYLGARRVIRWREPVLSLEVTDEHESLAQADPFPSKEPLTIQVFNRTSGGGPMDLAVVRDGRPVLTRRIVPGSLKPAEVRILPEAGAWSVRVTRIYGGRELKTVSFSVVE
jgi:hypothetical protein